MNQKIKSQTKYSNAQNPLILRCHRLMEAFAKSDDERDFYLEGVEQGSFVPPTVIEIDKMSELKREVFGPVLHVLRYQREVLIVC